MTHAAAQVALTNLRAGTYPITWWQNYGVTPWCYALDPNNLLYTIPMTDPGPDVSTLPIPDGVQFIPTIVHPAHVNTQELAWCQPWAAACGYVITFNEPYGEGATTVAQAIAVWPQIMALADAVGAKIIAPSIGWGTPGSDANTWWTDFQAAVIANGYRYDVLNFHATMGARDDSPGIPGQLFGTLAFLDSFHATEPNKDVWVTEWQFYFTAQDRFKQFIDGWLPALLSRPWVKRQACWPMGTDPTKPGGAGVSPLSLANVDGSLTTTGTQYVSQL